MLPFFEIAPAALALQRSVLRRPAIVASLVPVHSVPFQTRGICEGFPDFVD